MAKTKYIPKEVREAAASRVALGGKLRRVGQSGHFDVYRVEFPEDSDVTIGLPEAYLWDGIDLKVVTGEEALDLT